MKRGFTLIKLLVVISIIAILSNTIIVSLNSARGKGMAAEGIKFDKNNTSTFYNNTLFKYDFDYSTCSGVTLALDDTSQNNYDVNATIAGGEDCTDFFLNTVSALYGNGKSLFSAQSGERGFDTEIDTGGTSFVVKNSNNNFSISFWIKKYQTTPQTFRISLTDTSNNLIYIEYDPTAGGIRVWTYVNSLTQNNYYPGPADTNYTSVPTDDLWHNYLININSQKNILSIYIDGKVASANAITNSIGSVFRGAETNQSWLGIENVYIRNLYLDNFVWYTEGLP